MKYSIALLCLLFALACGGGGGGGGTSTPPDPQIPVISDPIYVTPLSVPVQTDGGQTLMKWQFTFTDAGGDVTTNVLEALSPSGAVTQTVRGPISGIAGMTSGSVKCQVLVLDGTVGDYPFRFYVVDDLGNTSNKISGTFHVTPYVPTNGAEIESHEEAKPQQAVGKLFQNSEASIF